MILWVWVLKGKMQSENMVEVDSITLLKWPIKQITMLNGSPLQRFVPIDGMHATHEDVSNDDNVGKKTDASNVVPLSRKRRYTFIKEETIHFHQ